MTKHHWSLVLLASIATLSSAQIPIDNLKAYYPFNGNAQDESGNGRHGSVYGPSLTIDRFGNSNRAFLFPGYISCGDWHPQIDNFSLSVWIKPLFFQLTNGTAVSDAGGYRGFRVYQSQDNIYFEIQGPGAYEVGFKLQPNEVNTWIHLVGVSDHGLITIYKNGVRVATRSCPAGYVGVRPFTIGYDPNVSSYYWQGKIDDVRVYGRSLSDSEIRSLYQELDWTPVLSGPLAYYPFNGNSLDETGNGNTLTPVSVTLASNRFGENSRAYAFGGVPSRMYADVGSGFSVSTVTMSLWVRHTGLPGANPRLLAVGPAGSSSHYYGLFIDNTTRHPNRLALIYNNLNIASDFECIPDGIWRHILVVYDGAEVRFYIDGVLNSATPASFTFQPFSSARLQIGYYEADSHSSNLMGSIDDIRIFNRPLSEDEIRQMFGEGRSTPPGYVAGKLQDANTQQPVQNATVRLTGGFDSYVSSTAGDGSFCVVAPSTGAYNLNILAAGYLGVTRSLVMASPSTTQLGILKLQHLEEAEFDLVELTPNPNPEISTVEQGGVFHRYYWVVGRRQRMPTNGVPVVFERSDGQQERSFVSANFEGIDGVVVVTYDADDIGCVDCDATFNLKLVNNKIVTSPIMFVVSARPRWSEKTYELDRNLDIDLGVALVANGSVGVGDKTMARLELQQCGLGSSSPDSVQLDVEFVSEAGASVGMGFGAKVGAGTSVGGNVDFSAGLAFAVRAEGDYKYGYDTPGDRIQNRAKMFDLGRAVLSLASHPLLARAIFALLTDSEVEQCQWDHLEKAEGGFGFKGEGSASALVGLFQPRKIGGSCGGSVSAGFEASMMLNFGRMPELDRNYGYLSLSGNIYGNGGVGFMLWKYAQAGRPRSEGLNKIKQRTGWGGLQGGEVRIPGLSFDKALRGEIEIGTWRDAEGKRQLDFSMTKGVNDWERKFSLSLSTEHLRDYLAGGALRALSSIANETEKVLPLPTVTDDFLTDAMDDMLTSVMERQVFAGVPPIAYRVDSALTLNSGGFSIDVHWAIVAKISVDKVGFDWRTTHRAVKERGVFSGFTGYPLEEYATIPQVSTPTIDALKKIFTDGFNTYALADLVKSVFLSFGGGDKAPSFHASSSNGGTILELSPIGSTLVIDPESVPPTLDSLSCQTWNWYGSSTEATASSLPAKHRQYANTIKKVQQEVARLDYGIGGFYKFSPQAVPLNTPGVLTIVYPDSDVVGIDETNLAIFQQDTVSTKWRHVGGVVNPDSNKITVKVDTLQLYTIAPVMPDGPIGLHSIPDTLVNDSASVAMITSDTLRLSNGEVVGSGKPYTLWSENVLVLATDLDTTKPGIQVNSLDSRLEFQIQTLYSAGKARVRVESVCGTAAGHVELAIIDTVKPAPPTIMAAIGEDELMRLVVQRPASYGITQYEVYFDRNSGAPYEGVALAGGENSPFTVAAKDTVVASRLMNDSLYYFSIRGIDGSGNKSDYSNEVTGIPLDTVSPGPIVAMDFSLADSTYLARWYAGGDNGTIGRASKYYVRVSSQVPVDTASWWSGATELANVTSPNESGSPDYHLLGDLPVDSTYTLGIQVEDEVGLKSPIALFRITENRATRTLTLQNGWNLMSTPIEPTGSPATLYPHLSAGPYTYTTGSGYTASDSVKALRGYWIKVDAEYQKDFNGMILADTLIPVVQGWNMIGANSASTSLSDVRTVPPGIIMSSFYEYTATGYDVPTHIAFGGGYWVKVSQNGSIILSGAGTGKKSVQQSPDKGIVLTGADQRSRSLWIVAEAGVAYYDAPPLGPEGTFDARYVTDRYAESAKQTTYEIVMHGTVYPLTITVKGMKAEEFEVVGAVTGRVYGVLGEGSHVKVLDAKDTRVTLNRVTIPTEYYLAQNYPNPFNPVTVIAFGLPEKSKVTAKVYDVLGREVTAILNDAEMKAGNHKVEWNAGKYATGVYFLRFQAGPYTNTKKMMMIK